MSNLFLNSTIVTEQLTKCILYYTKTLGIRQFQPSIKFAMVTIKENK